ncbi:MAG: DUF4013 domain-containing protein [Phototrophicaceae bacterium]|jgi:uncharacterized membrane protein
MFNMERTFSYIFEDEEWVGKVIVAALVSLGAVFSVLIFGLVFVAALNGWTIRLIRNMRQDVAKPMPSWSDFGGLIALGVNPLVAVLLYGVPLLGFLCIFTVVPVAFGGSEDAAAAAVVALLCLLIPLLIVYLVVAGLFYTVGMIRYSYTEKLADFFAFGALWATLNQNGSLTLRYLLWSVVIGVLFSVVNSTGIGSLVTLALQLPVTGHLLGQYAIALDGGKPKNKIKRSV